MISEIIEKWHTNLIDPERIPLIFAAFMVTSVVGMITGPLAGNANPLIWLIFSKFFGVIGDRLNKISRNISDLMFRGFLLTAFALFLALIAGKTLVDVAIIDPAYGLTEILILSGLITSGSVWFALLRLYFALEKQSVGEGAYYAISRSTRLNLTVTDDFGITRAGMGYAARSFDKGLVSPVIWYLIGGLPAAVIYSCLASLAWRFGKDGFTKGFGSVPLALERLMGFIPSAFAGILLVLAGLFTPTAKIHKGIASLLGFRSRAPYEQGGVPLSALAWSLNVSLGGASQDLSGSAIKGEWVGPEGATAQNSHKHLRRAIYINIMAHLLFLAALGGAYILSGRFFG